MAEYHKPANNQENAKERDQQQRPKQTPAKAPAIPDKDKESGSQEDRVTGPTKDDARG
jgi:hypothetical protein